MSTSAPVAAPAKVTAPGAAAPAAVKKDRKPRDPNAAPKSYIRTLSSGKDTLQFLALVGKNDTSFYVIQKERDEKGAVTKTTRGASAHFKNLADASVVLDKAVKDATAAGWTQRTFGAGAGRVAQADAFKLDSLPKPRK